MAIQNRERDIAALRAFNRVYTSRLGLLNAHLDKSPFTLSEARVLYELAHQTNPTAADIGRTLGLDRAQLSRTLKRFANRGLIEADKQPLRGRRRLLSLTKAGRAAFSALDSNTRAAIGALLDDLPPARRDRLLSAANAIIQVFDAPSDPPVLLRDPEPGDLGWITHQQGKLYANEYGWDWTFEALVAEIVGQFAKNFIPGKERCWVAEREGEVVGSVFVVRQDDETAKLRLLYVDSAARGLGLGRRLVDECISFARASGYKRIVLWTNDVLVSARRIYQAAGFELIDEEPHHSFGKDLVGQVWGRNL